MEKECSWMQTVQQEAHLDTVPARRSADLQVGLGLKRSYEVDVRRELARRRLKPVWKPAFPGAVSRACCPKVFRGSGLGGKRFFGTSAWSRALKTITR